jgi:hypothetical protein
MVAIIKVNKLKEAIENITNNIHKANKKIELKK